MTANSQHMKVGNGDLAISVVRNRAFVSGGLREVQRVAGQESFAYFADAAIAAGRVEVQNRIDCSIAVIGGAGSIS